uniref:Uncharacterized protein n=1 Tax=Anguilla anguilla TaxID=7936 RepID=A0A0E9QKY1_ANGAN
MLSSSLMSQISAACVSW